VLAAIDVEFVAGKIHFAIKLSDQRAYSRRSLVIGDNYD
jgi:hypothetical protein